MSVPILSTKLYIPPTRPKIVQRVHLTERLNRGLHSKLTLISAPAGFGKTALVSAWIAVTDRPAGWLSLDEDDSDPVRFLTYFIATLQTVAPHFGEALTSLLETHQPPPIDTMLTTLVNQITAIQHPFVIVLDDYHALDSQAIDSALAFLIENQPPQMHLVIATREDPQLPLARMRARGQLSELRATDLRFSIDEAANFLNRVMGLNLTEEDIATLEKRTEGWIAGLQLAALSMQGRADVEGFIQAFAGDHRYIVDYLVEEVLQRQPESVRTFLLQTSILDRLCGSLCNAVTDQEGGDILLDDLERGNLFVVPLDDRRLWFRYHHLFADVLHVYLMEERPDLVITLHQRASEWYRNNRFPADAVRHGLAAKDFERVANLVELAWPEMDESFQLATWLDWVESLPDDYLRVRPVLSVEYAWSLLNFGKLETADDYLRSAERWLDAQASVDVQPRTPSTEMVVIDEEQFQSLPATIASARAYHAQALGDILGSVKYGQRALDLLPEHDHLRRGIAASLLGVAYWANGELETAHTALANGMAELRMAGNLLFAIRGVYILADIRMVQGRLQEAVRVYEQFLSLAAEQGEAVLRGTADLHLRLSELYLEQDKFEATEQCLLRSEDLGEQIAAPIWQYRLYLAQARVKKAQGDLDGALDLLNKSERKFIRTPVPEIHPLGALKAQVWIAQGKLNEALVWAREQGLSVDDDLSFLREFEHITLTRIHIAQHRNGVQSAIDEALELLERLLTAAEEGGRNGSVIEILILQALALEACGDITTALTPLARALTLAEPEGYVRIFVDEGQPMALLLSEAVVCGIMSDYARKLLTAFQSVPGQSGRASSQPLIEPLSERELEILGLVADGFSNREISERLFLALSTVKGHNRNIFEKLQVKRRTEAVARAHELGLI